MPPKPSAYRQVYRTFDSFEFDSGKSALNYEFHGIDFYQASRIFPGFVFERDDTRSAQEARFQAIGEADDELYFVVYTVRGSRCRLISAWIAEREERVLWHELR